MDVYVFGRRWPQDDDVELFTEDGNKAAKTQAHQQQPTSDWWSGPNNGLYRVGFSGRGLLGAGADALRAAADIAGRWQAEVAASSAAGGPNISSSV